MKRKNSAKVVFWSLSHPLHAYEAIPGQSSWTCRHYGRNLSKSCSEPFCNERKGLEVTFCQHGFKCNVQEHRFLYFYDEIINSYPDFMICLIFSPYHRSNSRHYQVMDLFKSKESFKKNFIQIITEKRNDFRVTSFFKDYHQEFCGKPHKFLTKSHFLYFLFN